MKLASINTNWPALQGFYQNLAEELHRRGVMSLTTGGIACVFYDLAQSTKDCDIIIPIEKAGVVLDVLSQIDFLGHKGHLTLKYGAPLAPRWLNGGWSSHTYYGTTIEPLARVDFFGRAPRVKIPKSDENPLFLARGGVAEMKKTRREKDWAYSNLLGLQMLKRGNPEGLLHITDPKCLFKAAQGIAISEVLKKERPLLGLVEAKSPELERYLKVEKEFWSRLDNLRLAAYEAAWAPYGAELQNHTELLNMELLEQNQAMVSIAGRTLDPAPLNWKETVERAKEETANIFRDVDVNLFPSPAAFSGQEDGWANQSNKPEL